VAHFASEFVGRTAENSTRLHPAETSAG
jgi:hypothetical protein